ncbi:MAG: folate-binding protein YgfZ [Methylocystis sp.]|nr:folate-binding protein YgfZ [Methylocystis sp.]MBI3274659.1 folate-binding protein YgfZ [Methylocystis sp.]
MTGVVLADRGVVEVAGADAAQFLHGLVTNDVLSLGEGEARFAALLSPQGKILCDFLVFANDAGGERVFLLDCPGALASDLVRRLTIYKLRAPVTIADRSAQLASLAFPNSVEKPKVTALALAPDPRAPKLGWRALAARGEPAPAGAEARESYEMLRIAAGVPDGGVDFVYGDAFPHEANMDRLKGIDFEKGCFVGQEVVARMQHRGAARKRVIAFRARGLAPAPGTPVCAGAIELGVAGSRVGEHGLALIRLDRLNDAKAKGLTPRAGGVELDFVTADG